MFWRRGPRLRDEAATRRRATVTKARRAPRAIDEDIEDGTDKTGGKEGQEKEKGMTTKADLRQECWPSKGHRPCPFETYVFKEHADDARSAALKIKMDSFC